MFCKNCSAVPESSSKEISVGPAHGASCIAGLYDSYELFFPQQLKGLIDEDLYFESVEEVNATLQRVWPCLGHSIFAGSCCLCSLGGSFFIPAMCATQSEEHAIQSIERVNRRMTKERIPLWWTLKRKRMSSWIQIEILVSSNSNNNDMDHEHPEAYSEHSIE